jgi:lysophospholipase L1-like esterase
LSIPRFSARASGASSSCSADFLLSHGWDRTQNVPWRLDHGEFEGLHPKYVVVNIGTNNFAGTKNARASTPEEIAEGVREILLRVRAKAPKSRIILMGIFPRGENRPTPARESRRSESPARRVGKTLGITFLDLTEKLTQPDGTITRAVMGDFLHPSDAGNATWGEALNAAMK